MERADPDAEDGFYARLPVFDSFSRLTDPSVYAPLPEGWVLGLSDIVASTAAIGRGGYKAVNGAAAAVIAAIANAWPGGSFPFVFGGDGASFALPPSKAASGREALAAVAAWARDELELELRVAMVPLSAVRAAGLDVRVARYAPSPDVSYAMFAGGGLAFAEARMKAGDFAVAPAPPGAHPDLAGLSCRFDPMPSRRGVILSVIALPAVAADPDDFSRFVARLLTLVEESGEAERPVTPGGPPVRWPPAGFGLEAKASGAGRIGRVLSLGLRSLAAHAVFRTGLRVGGFDPKAYRRQLVENSDFRKFDDGLRMTLDCTPALAARIEAALAEAEAAGLVRAGTHRQDAALMTCFVPAIGRADHVHFIDGAGGGYAAAAQGVKHGT